MPTSALTRMMYSAPGATDGLGLTLADALTLGETEAEGLREAEGDTEALADREADTEGDRDAEGLRLELTDALGLALQGSVAFGALGLAFEAVELALLFAQNILQAQ